MKMRNFLYINNKEICKRCWIVDDFAEMSLFEAWFKIHKGDSLCVGCKYILEYTVIGRKNETD